MLSDKAIAVVAEAWAQSSDLTIPKQCHEQFRARSSDAEETGVWPTQRHDTIVAMRLDLAASIGTAFPASILEFTSAYRTEDFNAFGFYCGRLASLKRIDPLRAFFGQSLEKDELYDLATI